ncbi:LOW QUALITY PROTEIN: coiled-coil domain-containing protein 87, partial [Lontra canadensis]|uniref:LOW QUALITY PROTEIN: coiled-coil domain-containing protein 87 n=1 Tax=Lontra canadensis TaxID=76717 RepID=UPI0013F32C2F
LRHASEGTGCAGALGPSASGCLSNLLASSAQTSRGASAKMEPYKPEPELQRFYHRLLGPLSLFPRKATRPESQKRLPPEVPMLLPLPVSRLTVASLCSQVTNRLASSGLAVRVPTESRLRFTEVILDELKCSWQEPPTEPTLSHLNNQRLRKRLQAYVLYFKYLTNQETDFLHVIFQMYEEEVPVETKAPVREPLKIQYPPPLLEDEEPDFVPEEWNWSTVLEHRLGNKKISLLREPYKILNLQKRLERLWSILEVPDKDRLDMAIKYSSNARLRQLPSLVSAWEQALKPIQLREMLLGRLEWFERQASDPNRFFQKTAMDLSRFLEESQFRSRLHRKISVLQAPLASLLEEIESVFGEPVTFRGRRYLDKMKHDKVEMLYWLQQRQRVRHLTQGQKASYQPGLFKKLSSQPLTTPGNTPITL